jgi:hypothetical protein
MRKVVSEDSARRALKGLDEKLAGAWLKSKRQRNRIWCSDRLGW